jgi:hypothetical protein
MEGSAPLKNSASKMKPCSKAAVGGGKGTSEAVFTPPKKARPMLRKTTQAQLKAEVAREKAEAAKAVKEAAEVEGEMTNSRLRRQLHLSPTMSATNFRAGSATSRTAPVFMRRSTSQRTHARTTSSIEAVMGRQNATAFTPLGRR